MCIKIISKQCDWEGEEKHWTGGDTEMGEDHRHSGDRDVQQLFISIPET